MNKLENKILKKVYWFETKRTLKEVAARIIAILMVGFFGFILISLLADTLVQQGSFDVFDIFNDDFEVVRQYFSDNIFIFFEEIPKTILVLTTVSFVLITILIIFFIKNFKKIKNRVKSIINYWFK